MSQQQILQTVPEHSNTNRLAVIQALRAWRQRPVRRVHRHPAQEEIMMRIVTFRDDPEALKPTFLTRYSEPKHLVNYTVYGDEASALDPDLAWKLDVGAECNRVLELADALDSHSGKNAMRLVQGCYETNVQHTRPAVTTADLRSLVQRVATFEELEYLTDGED
jgi:hypothetical protein